LSCAENAWTQIRILHVKMRVCQAMCQTLQQFKQSIYFNTILSLLEEKDQITIFTVKIDFCFIVRLIYSRLHGTDWFLQISCFLTWSTNSLPFMEPMNSLISTWAYHWTLHFATWIQSMSHIFKIQFNIILLSISLSVERASRFLRNAGNLPTDYVVSHPRWQ
jgi:hypothetical protein